MSLRSWLCFPFRLNEFGVGRTDARNLDDHRFAAGFGEMRAARRLGVIASDGQRLQRGGIELIAVSEVPGSRYYGGYAVIAMLMCGDARVRGDVQHDGVETSGVRIALHDHGSYALNR